MKCSVIILNWNGEAMLRRYLPSVLRYTDHIGYEVVVADNGSTDDSINTLRCDFPSVRIIQLDKNYGFAEGYNMALKQVDAEYSVLLNSDVEVTEKWLETLLEYMDAHPEVAAVQPKVLSWLSKEEQKEKHGPILFEHAGAAGGYLDALAYPFCRGRVLSKVEEDNGQYDSPADIFWATGACLCIRTRIYKEVGGLDAEFFAHMEEIDLCWRLNCRGHRLVCVPQSVVYHLGGGALNYENPRKTYLNFRNNLLMIYKNAPVGPLWRMMIARFFLDYVAALQLLLTGKPKNAWAVVRARWDFLHIYSRFAEKRKQNSEQAVVAYPPIIANRSIVLDYLFH